MTKEEEEKLAELGKPRLGEITKISCHIRESMEFKVSCSVIFATSKKKESENKKPEKQRGYLVLCVRMQRTRMHLIRCKIGPRNSFPCEYTSECVLVSTFPCSDVHCTVSIHRVVK